MQMKLIFKNLYLFSPQEKKAKVISFEDGINIITSNQEDGTDRGKSVTLRSLYHALGAEANFEAKWDTKSKVYILHFCIDNSGYYIYRSCDLYKLFDNDKRLLFTSTHSRDLAAKLKDITHFSVMLPSRADDKLEITPPVYNYLPFFLDQDHYDGSKYTSFKNLQMYPDFKDSVLFYHLGIYDEHYFDLVRQKERLTEAYETHLSRLDMLKAMKEDVEKRIGTGAYSTDLDALKKDIGLYQREYSEVLTKLNACKAKLIDLRNHLIDYESLLAEMQQFSQTNEKEIKKLNQHLCPECGSILSETIHLRSKRYNLAEDIVAIKNDIQASIVNVSQDIETEEGKYQQLLIELKQYETKVKMNTQQVNDVIRYKGLCEIRDGIVVEKSDLGDTIVLEGERISALDKELRSYNAKKKKIEEEYYQLLSSSRTRFGLFEIDSDKFKKLTNNFTASGSNKNIATIIWYLTIIELRNRFNSSAISFPVVFDSPNNVETDNTKKHSLLQYILENAGENQLILSSIGFSTEEFPGIKNINVITLENSKYALLDAETYLSNEALLNEFCDAVDSKQKS